MLPLAANSQARKYDDRSCYSRLSFFNKVNQTSFKATRAKLAQHPIEEVGAKLRDMMPWIKKGALVDKTKN